MKLSNRQQQIIDAIAQFKAGSRGIVRQYEFVLSEYWGIDSRSCNNLSFFLNALKRQPRLLSAARKLLPMYAPVNVAKVKGEYVVTNKQDVSKKAKARLKGEVKKLIALELTSLLNHPAIKVEVVFEWNERRQTSFKSQVAKLIGNGVKVGDLIDLMEEAANEEAERQEEEARNAIIRLEKHIEEA